MRCEPARQDRLGPGHASGRRHVSPSVHEGQSDGIAELVAYTRVFLYCNNIELRCLEVEQTRICVKSRPSYMLTRKVVWNRTAET